MKKNKQYEAIRSENLSEISDYEKPYGITDTFVVKKGDQQVSYEVRNGYGYYLNGFKSAKSLAEVAGKLEDKLTYAEISPIIDFLDLKMVDLAKAAAVSQSTVSRWSADSKIGIPGSYQFFKIDEVIKKGMEIFGRESSLKSWMNTPNMALGQVKPRDLLVSMTGIDLAHEAIDALQFGNVM
ncbi:putative toxin-antitoxin system antitoxin component, TIGR02293 family [Cyclobacterium lianum]|uniref:Putative toxin-antitoxin system antitoxin component, TIGR02293 family n=1 Tax=Cyclobacterium lianum TaxID=388280 RepID=A0A1M7M3R0_9BACT|nr:antitoxin Xre/MbcA/ParS toxin-binding domain-containing protein [Cyclobacterium lianum]SHM85297.1 putative toxin-antitoxin system antitoxin component, TIGR02293 family [Cyclobacterium lianum]